MTTNSQSIEVSTAPEVAVLMNYENDPAEPVRVFTGVEGVITAEQEGEAFLAVLKAFNPRQQAGLVMVPEGTVGIGVVVESSATPQPHRLEVSTEQARMMMELLRAAIDGDTRYVLTVEQTKRAESLQRALREIAEF